MVKEAIAGLRDHVFLVTKVWPTNASYDGVQTSLRNSLHRLGVDTVDLYLLHWPSRSYPLEETLDSLMDAKRHGMTHRIGVSNFPRDWTERAIRHVGSTHLAVNQVEYSLTRRAVEHSVIPYCQDQKVRVMAYSPLKTLPREGHAYQVLRQVAEKHEETPHTVALAWVIAHEGVLAIPKAVQPDHIDQNRRALSVILDLEDLAVLDNAFPRTDDEMTVSCL